MNSINETKAKKKNMKIWKYEILSIKKKNCVCVNKLFTVYNLETKIKSQKKKRTIIILCDFVSIKAGRNKYHILFGWLIIVSGVGDRK